MSIQIRSFNQILGDMVRKVVSDTALNDLNTGSVLLTLLEAAAANDFENNAAILNVLELLNIDAIKNNDLDAKAGDFGLSRQPAIKASGFVDISNSSITKRSTGLYVVKPAPIAGQIKLYVNNTDGWSESGGSLYIGRNTGSFEGPIEYTSITQYATYSEITLASALKKDHLMSDIVIDSQGEPDRVISAGTIVKVPANNQNPEIQYITLRNAVIPSGESVVKNVEVIALVAGTLGNAGINTITSFDSLPFSGATVTNVTAFSNGRDIETDSQLRNRLKSYSITLARGTAPSIISAIIGVSDPDDNNQVASAVITEPTTVGDPSILYIDDGSGFQPSFAGQGVDVLLSNATGKEEFLQLANYPIPRPQVISNDPGPFTIKDGSFLRVSVDGQEEVVYFNESDFVNISAATMPEVIVAINSQSTLYKARFANKSSSILIYPVAHDAETIRVTPIRSTDDSTLYVNSILKFPTDEFSYISLYQNSARLREKAKSAELETTSFAQWNVAGSTSIVIEVDGTPAQDRSFAISDFNGISSWSSVSIEDWASVFNKKFAGLTASVTPNQTILIKSNKVGSESSIAVIGGDLMSKWFANLDTTSIGQTAQFELNRQTGNIRILTTIEPGDTIAAGTNDAKGFILSNSTNSGLYNFATDSYNRPSNMVFVVDSTFCNSKTVALSVGSTISITNPSPNTMRITSANSSTFNALTPGDYLYVCPKNTWVNSNNSGLFRIKAKGGHTQAGIDSFIEIDNINAVEEGPISITDSSDIKAFNTDGLPQVWRGVTLSNPPTTSISDLVTSINNNIAGAVASVYKSNAVKVTSTSETNGSIALPVVVGSASAIFNETIELKVGNAPHVATTISSKSLISGFKRTIPVGDNVFLDRHTYTSINGPLSNTSQIDIYPYSQTYSETLQSSILSDELVDVNDYIYFTSGNNQDQLKTIKAKIDSTTIGTQQGLARTEINHTPNDNIELLTPIALAPEDNMVVVMDNDSVNKTINIKFSRTGRVNSGSGLLSYVPTTTEFSATDEENEPGIDFSNLNVWGKAINGTNFADYAVWMRARNWYASGGINSTDGKMLIRSAQYGPNGEKMRFSIQYPQIPDQSASTSLSNSPSYGLYSYYFGSGPARATALNAGYSVYISGPYPDSSTNFPNGSTSSGRYYDYTFSAGNFGVVSVGDIVSILDGSGLSVGNLGQYRVEAKNANTIRLYNPNSVITVAGTKQETYVTTIADIVGSPTEYNIQTVGDSGGSLHQAYFIISDSNGSVAVWYDIDNSGAVPPVHGADRAIKIATVSTGDTDVTVAIKTSQTLALDSAFTVTQLNNTVNVINVINGAFNASDSATSGFLITDTIGTADISLDGKYFLLNDMSGSVAVWFDVGNDGTLEPIHGANRSIKVSGVNYGDDADTVATILSNTLNSDYAFDATNIGNSVSIINSDIGQMPIPNVSTSGFSITFTLGLDPIGEIIANANRISFFALNENDVATIIAKINEDDIIEATAVGNSASLINRSTKQENYLYIDDSTALGLGHNPDDDNANSFIGLCDGINWIKEFSNVNPNFILKIPLMLNNVAPSMYSMNSAINIDGSIGELFKLIPVSVNNIYHHLSQKALSQLPIVANINITQDRKNIQINSKQLGSLGSVEIVGGTANTMKSYVVGESEVISDNGNKYLLSKISAYPDTFNVNDYVILESNIGTKRISRLKSTDTMATRQYIESKLDYIYNPKAINMNYSTSISIADVSHLYDRPVGSGIIWRWTHDGSASLSQVQQGDIVYAFGPTIPLSQGNKVSFTGDREVAGFPIVAVNDGMSYFDILNPNGSAMGPTQIGNGNTIQICTAPLIKWNLKHCSPIKIKTITRTLSSIVTVQTLIPHNLNTGDNIQLYDCDNLADGLYSNITCISNNSFTINLAGVNFSEGASGAYVMKQNTYATQYKLERLGFNGLVKLSYVGGTNPQFKDCGVAVDDYIIIKGTTFGANNTGQFRVLGVDNDSIIFKNDSATDELNTIRAFNNKNYYATWTANTNTITGVAGTFKNVMVGNWIKKSNDPDSAYVQVISMSPNSPELAESIILGSNYSGSTGIAAGVTYNMATDHKMGIILQNRDDITLYEGDSCLPGDTLYVQNITNSNWFAANNCGSFTIEEVGTTDDYRPFVRVGNSAGSEQINVALSVNSAGIYITEGINNRFSSIRKIEYSQLDDVNRQRRSLYLTPHNRAYKFNESNMSTITHLGKFGYNTKVTSGIDGYLYYTGLLRRTQRIIDGYEPDISNYPGRRAIGGSIEILPPLNKRISMIINVTTSDGINLGDISNSIKSTVINYINSLGVGEDVILSELIARIMDVKGVGAATFTNPVPSTERIYIASNEKATISPSDIGIA